MFILLLRFIADNISSNRVKLKCGKFKVEKTFRGRKTFLVERTDKHWNKFPREVFKNGFNKQS